MAKSPDTYTQRLTTTVGVGAGIADVSEFAAFTDSYNPEDTTGFVIKEARYNFELPLHGLLAATADRIKFGLSYLQTFPVGGPEANDPGILDFHAMSHEAIEEPGTPPAAGVDTNLPFLNKSPEAIRDFTNFDGESGNNGLIVHPVNLFGWVYTDCALGGVLVLHITIEYKTVPLSDALFKQLWQSIYIRQV